MRTTFTIQQVLGLLNPFLDRNLIEFEAATETITLDDEKIRKLLAERNIIKKIILTFNDEARERTIDDGY